MALSNSENPHIWEEKHLGWQGQGGVYDGKAKPPNAAQESQTICI